MQSVDGDVRLSVKFDMKSVKENLTELKKSISDTMETFQDTTSGSNTQFDELQKSLQKTAQDVEKLSKRLEELSKERVSTKSYEELSKDLQDANSKFDEIADKQQVLADAGKTTTDEFEALEAEANKVGAEIEAIEAKMKEVSQTSSTATPPIDTTNYDKLSESLKSTENEFDNAKNVANEFNVDTSTATEGVSSKLLQLQANVAKAAEKIELAKAKLKEFESQPAVPTAEYSSLLSQLDSANAQFDKLYNTQQEWLSIGISPETAAFKDLDAQLEEVGATIQNLTDKKKQMESEGTAFKSDEAKYQQLVNSVQAAEREYEIAKVKLNEFNAAQNASAPAAQTASNSANQVGTSANTTADKIAKLEARVKELESRLQKVGKSSNKFGINLTGMVSKVNKAFSKLASKVKSVFSSIIKNLKNTSKTSGDTFSNINGAVKKGIKTILKYGFSIKSLYILVRKLKQFISEGYKNLAGYSDEVNNSISSVLSALTKLKNSLAVAFQPIVNVVAPILTSLINKLSDAANSIGQFLAAFTGQDYAYKALATTTKYFEDTTEATKEAEKAVEDYLSPLDDLNKYSDPSTSTKDATSKEVDPSTMFETVSVSDKFKNLAKTIKDVLNSNDWTSIGTMIGEKINSALTKINWSSIQSKASEIATKIFTLFNGFIAALDWTLLGMTIGNGIQTGINFLYTLITGFDFSALGAGIANAINGIIASIDIKKLAATLSNFVTGLFNILISLLSNIKWDKVGTTITNFLSSIKWTKIGNVVISLFNSITSAINSFNFSGIATAFANGISKINWSKIWDSLTTATTFALQAVLDLFGLKGANTNKLNSALKSLKTPIDSIFKTISKTVKTLITPIVNDFLPSIINLIGNILDGITPIIKAVTPVFDTLITSVSSVIQSLAPVISSIGTIIANIINVLTPIFEPIAGLITNIVNFLSPAISAISGFVSQILGFLTPISIIVGDVLGDLFGTKETPSITTIMSGEIENLSNISSELSTVSDNIDTTIQGVNESLASSAEDIQYIDDLRDRLIELIEKGTLTDSEMTELNTIADLISEKYPEFKDTWDKMTFTDDNGKLTFTKNKEEMVNSINSVIDSLKQQYATEALKEQYTQLYKQEYEANKQVASAKEKVAEATEKGNEVSQKNLKIAKELEKQAEDGTISYQQYYDSIDKLNEETHKYSDALKSAQEEYLIASAKQEELKTKSEQLANATDVLSGSYTKASENFQAFRDAYDLGFITDQDIKEKFNSTAETVIKESKSLAERTAEGYELGIAQGVADIRLAGGTVGSAAIEGAREALGIHSPSKEFENIADYTVRGFTNKINKDNTVQKAMQGLMDKIKNTVKSGINAAITAMESLPLSFRHIFNQIWTSIKPILNDMLNGFENFFNNLTIGMNTSIDNLNSLSKSIGETTGKSYYIYPKFSNIGIPKLAQGAVIPPNKEFMAILGDQKSGRNIEAPESLIRQIVREETATQKTSGNVYEIPIKIGRKTLIKLIIDEAKLMLAQSGQNPFELV